MLLSTIKNSIYKVLFFMHVSLFPIQNAHQQQKIKLLKWEWNQQDKKFLKIKNKVFNKVIIIEEFSMILIKSKSNIWKNSYKSIYVQ